MYFSYKQNDIIFFITPVGNLPEIEECLYRPLVIFSHSQISRNSQSKHCHFQTFFKLFHFVVVILITRLAVILKFLYLFCYGYDQKACEVQCLTAKSINNFKHRNDYPLLKWVIFHPIFQSSNAKCRIFAYSLHYRQSRKREKTQTFCRTQIFVLLFTHQLQDKIYMINIIIKAPPGFPTFISEY